MPFTAVKSPPAYSVEPETKSEKTKPLVDASSSDVDGCRSDDVDEVVVVSAPIDENEPPTNQPLFPSEATAKTLPVITGQVAANVPFDVSSCAALPVAARCS